MFKEELRFIADASGVRLARRGTDLRFWRSGALYLRDGAAFARVRRDPGITLNLLSDDPGGPTGCRRGGSTLQRIWRANQDALLQLEWEAVAFIRQVGERYAGLPKVVAFSGGKDSAVVSHLVRRALGSGDVLHVFADTTLELPETYAYLRHMSSLSGGPPLVTAHPANDFSEMCRRLGPPSRLIRWCCTTQKVAPLSRVYRALAHEGGVLSFGGIRRQESVRRRSHERVLLDTKIEGEIFASPIIDWTDAEVWIYSLTRGIPINMAYRKGFDRIGCAVCPMNSAWSEQLYRAWHPREAGEWDDVLTGSIAAACGSVPQARKYVGSGSWKARAGYFRSCTTGWDIGRSSCAHDDNAFTYEVPTCDSTTFWEYMRPLGDVEQLHADGIVEERLVLPKSGVFSLQLRMVWPRRHLRVVYRGPANLKRRALSWLERQLRKGQSCVRCGACVGVCPTGAIRLGGAVPYLIDPGLCVGCLRCVTKLQRGCPAVHSLSHYGGP